MIDIAGKPFIARQLDYLYLQGIKHVVICVGYKGKQIEDFVGDGSKFNLKVKYSYDGNELLGTGGSIKKALPLLGKNFYILYGDSFLPINYLAIEKTFKNSKKPALMTIFKNQGKWDVSNISFHKKRIRYDKKNPTPDMEYIDYGLSIVNSSVFNLSKNNKNFDMVSIYHQLSLNDKLAAFEVYDRFYEIGSLNGLNETIDYFNKIK